MWKWSLNPTLFFEIAEEYIRSRSPELLLIRLETLDRTQGFMLNQEVRQRLDEIISTLDLIKNWEQCYFDGHQFIIIEGVVNA